MTNPNLPDSFWATRPILAQIRQQAWSRIVSPDAVLHVFLAGYSWKVPASYEVENPTGDLIHFHHQPLLVGPSGSGKSAAEGVACRLFRDGSNVEVLHPTHRQAREYMKGAMGDTFYYVTPFDPSLPDERVESLQAPLDYADPLDGPITIPLSDDLRHFLFYLAQQALRGESQDNRKAQERLLQAAALFRVIDGPNTPTGYIVTVEDWNLAVQLGEASSAMRSMLQQEVVQELVEKYAVRVLDRVGGTIGCSLSHILQGWSSMNTRSTIRDVVLPALVRDGTLTLQDGRYTA